MQTPSEPTELFEDLHERAQLVTDLDGPQIEAWASGLYAALHDRDELLAFVAHCRTLGSDAGLLVCRALAELAAGFDEELAGRATEAAASRPLPPQAAQIGGSVLQAAWSVEARFGRSVVLGFDHPAGAARERAVPSIRSDDADDTSDMVDATDHRHSVLIEIDDEGRLEDIQLAGPADDLLREAAESSERVEVESLAVADAVDRVVAAWPDSSLEQDAAGPGVAANQQFVRHRILVAGGIELPPIDIVAEPIDVRRGMDEADYAAANRAAVSTLRAAVGPPAETGGQHVFDEVAMDAWVGVIRGDGGDLSARERNGLLWLEWADWLGVGIGLLRGGPGSPVSGATFVDLVNRCPEVSSTIARADREYVEWAFEVAIDVLADAGVVEDGRLTDTGHAALHAALLAAWEGGI